MELLIALIWTAGALGLGYILQVVSLRGNPGKRSTVQAKAADGNTKVRTQGGIRALLVG